MRGFLMAGALCLALAAPALAQSPGDSISIAERRIMMEYFAAHAAKASPDGKPALPRRLEVGDKLPSGLEGRPLPAELAGQLPARPEDRRLVIMDDDIVLLEPGSRRVLDVLIDGARG